MKVVNQIRKLFKSVHMRQAGQIGIIILILLAIAGGFAADRWVLPVLLGTGEALSPNIPPEELRVTQTGFGCDCALSTYGEAYNAFPHAIVNMTMSMDLSQFQFRMGRKTSGDKVFRAGVWLWDTNYPIVEGAAHYGTLIGYSDTISWNDIPYWAGWDYLQPWCIFEFSSHLQLYQGQTYILGVVKVSGNNGDIVSEQYGLESLPCISSKEKGLIVSTAAPAWVYTNRQTNYWIVGGVAKTPQVVTLGYVLESDGSITLKGWTDVVGDMECGFVVSSNETNITNGQGAWYESGHSGISSSKYYFDKRLVSIVSDTTYYFRAYSRLSGMTWLGNIESFNRNAADVPVNLQCNVIRNTIEGVVFDTAILGTHESVTYNVTIYYGEDLLTCTTGNLSIEVATDVTNDTSWQTTAGCGTLFEAGTKYFYRAGADGDDSSLSYSEIHSFIAYDQNQPGLINKLSQLFNLPFNTLWWILIIILLFVVWAFAAWRKWWWLGILGTMVAMIALITFGFVNAWVVVLLIICAGYIIFKVIFAFSSGSGGHH